MLIYVPIEPLPARYSIGWHESFMRAFEARSGLVVVGDREVQTIEHGEFLDVYGTNVYKARQLAEIISTLSTNHESLATVFFMDAWFPGVEMLAYIRTTTGRPIKIKGMLHAGCYDHNDFLNRTGCSDWGTHLERSWLRIYDELFVATEFHREMLADVYGPLPCRVTVTPFLGCCAQDIEWADKEDLVVFPHRLAAEKQPHVFDLLKTLYEEVFDADGIQWVRTKDMWDIADPLASKRRYYDTLRKAKVAFSSALQETFGIAMLEATAYGAWPVAPNRLSYRETLAEYPLYDTLDEAVKLVHAGLVGKYAGSSSRSARYDPDLAASIIASKL